MPVWIYLAAALTLLATGFGSGWEVRAWKAGSDASLSERTIVRLDDNISTLGANQKTLQAFLDAQNASVAALKAKGDEATARAETALAGLRAASLRAKTMADQVAMLLPPVGGEVCSASDAVITGALK